MCVGTVSEQLLCIHTSTWLKICIFYLCKKKQINKKTKNYILYFYIYIIFYLFIVNMLICLANCFYVLGISAIPN